MGQFCHLHNHTQYSLLDGAIRPKDLVARAAEYGHPAVAITDHGNMSGAVEFYQAAEKADIKPIIGVEAYLEPDLVGEKRTQYTHHITLLAANNVGYQNLIKLSSYAYLENFYYKPRIPQDMLLANNDGIICLSGCIQGILNHYILKDDIDTATHKLMQFKEAFGDRYFMEVHDHRLENEIKVRPHLIRLASKHSIPLVAANDVHFLRKFDHAAHDILVCIGMSAKKNDDCRMRYSSELYFKTEDEMLDVFKDVPEAVYNTVRVADMVDFKMDFSTSKYPAFVPPGNKTQPEYLRELCWSGIRERYGERSDRDPELRKRLEYELSVIEKTGFVSYFLIVWDFINYARLQGIPVGPGRGSAAGSIVAYCLHITDVDPIRFGLIFERFLNPDRISPPDIDIDFCMDRRGEVIDYVFKKYGERCVSQIITFNTLGAKSAVRDVGRVMEIDYDTVNRLAKLIPVEVGITLKDASNNPEIQAMLQQDINLVDLWMAAESLEGLSRNAGVHAAGIVIADRPLDKYIPLCRGKEKEVISQYSMKPLGDLGLLKMDFLGLKTLTVIDGCVRLIRERTSDFDISKIPLDDQATFDIYNRGETLGVFQMESGGITSCCKRFDVKRIDDIVAIGALYRPGPLQFLDDYIARKHGYREINFAHPLLEDVCNDTCGIMVYQEQVQRAANVMAGYTLGEADLLRRAMGKKDKEKMDMERSRFINGCKRANNIHEGLANEIFDWISAFARYGFNKAHAVSYGWLSYQTAYLKAHYPTEFMSAMLSHDAQDLERMSQIVTECKRMDIAVLPPDINDSGMNFRPVKGGIRFGLKAIRNVGDYPASIILTARERSGAFSSLTDLCSRVDVRKVNKKTLEGLIRGGACDSFMKSRAQLVQDMANVMKKARNVQKEVMSGQIMMFEDMVLDPKSHPVPPWPRHEMLAYEKDALGFYVSGHPLEEYIGYYGNKRVSTVSKALQLNDIEAMASLVGIIVSVDKRYRKSDNTPFAIVKLEDFTGQIEILVWDKKYTDFKECYFIGNVVGIKTKLTRRDDGVRASAVKVAALQKRRH